jgi:isopentenyl diphosphate isomerase/L-lactate dehydrogenase-like FMN-dependent dehydrogenase
MEKQASRVFFPDDDDATTRHSIRTGLSSRASPAIAPEINLKRGRGMTQTSEEPTKQLGISSRDYIEATYLKYSGLEVIRHGSR